MTAKRVAGAGILLLLAVVLGFLAFRGKDPGNGGRVTAAEPAAEEEGARAGSEEFDEETAQTAERIEALQQAKAVGKFGQVAATTKPMPLAWTARKPGYAPNTLFIASTT